MTPISHLVLGRRKWICAIVVIVSGSIRGIYPQDSTVTIIEH